MSDKKAITKSMESQGAPINGEGVVFYDCDFSLFEPIVKQMNEMGAPVTLCDLMELIEGKLSGRIVSGIQDAHLVYTLIVHEKKEQKPEILSAMGEFAKQECIELLKHLSSTGCDFSAGDSLDDEGAKQFLEECINEQKKSTA